MHFAEGPVGWRREQQIDGQFESAVDHPGQDRFEKGTGCFQTGVAVDTNQPRLEVFVQQKLQLKQLKGWIFPILSPGRTNSLQKCSSALLEFGQHLLSKRPATLGFIQLILEIVKRYLIALF